VFLYIFIIGASYNYEPKHHPHGCDGFGLLLLSFPTLGGMGEEGMVRGGLRKYKHKCKSGIDKCHVHNVIFFEVLNT
jgi:hypothetical protein